jgi:hypothetical protein
MDVATLERSPYARHHPSSSRWSDDFALPLIRCRRSPTAHRRINAFWGWGLGGFLFPYRPGLEQKITKDAKKDEA